MKRGVRIAAAGAVITGLATLISASLVLSLGQPEPYQKVNAAGFTNAILWFELVDNPAEVFDVLGVPNSEGLALRATLDQINRLDFVFLACYSLFNAALIVFVRHLNTYRFNDLLRLTTFLVLGLLLSAGMFVGDYIENGHLLAFTKAKSVADISIDDFNDLWYWTRVKWASIAGVCLMLSVGYVAYFRRIPTLLLSVAYTVAGVAICVAISLPDARWIIERYGVPVLTAAWIVSLFHAFSVLLLGVRPPLGVVQAED